MPARLRAITQGILGLNATSHALYGDGNGEVGISGPLLKGHTG